MCYEDLLPGRSAKVSVQGMTTFLQSFLSLTLYDK